MTPLIFFILAGVLLLCAIFIWRDLRANSRSYADHEAFIDAELARLKAAGIEPTGDVWKESGE